MAVRLQKSFTQPHYTVSCPSWLNSSEQVPLISSKNISSNVESSTSPHICPKAKHLGLQLLDQESSSTQSIGQSHDSVGALGRTNSQDQSFSSESGENESHAKGMEAKMKPVFFSSPLDTTGNPSQTDYTHPMARAPYPYGDVYYGGLFTAYGAQSMIQPQMVPLMGMTGARIALPLDLADDGPIYVNAKQYHGILRRRQSRAKLEAQNKLVKSRKPYLHESRHLHALNRVRGSGGRFLSTKNLQQTNPSTTTVQHGALDSIPSRQKNTPLDLESHSRTGPSVASNSNFSVAPGSVMFTHPELCFSGISTNINVGLQSSGSFIHDGNQHCASIIR